MPVFHTKTIESILEPVAQQVSRLVILHEEAEDGNAMPDLERPVQAVSRAVSNLAKVGRETINSSDDPILRQDMPASLLRVEQASKLLEEASSMLKMDPYSQPARKKLIEGSRGILQGTSSLLLCFDESEVRKIIRECKKVLDYLAVAEVIESMEDLVQFVKDLSPCLTKVSRDVDAREKELTHQVHREILMRCLEQVKTLAPILICSMKIFIQIITQPSGKGAEEAAENRNYLAARMTDEINEIIRVLQLTTYDEDEWDADILTVMKKAENAIGSKLQAANDWLQDPLAVRGGVGEKSLRNILELSGRVADRALPQDREAIHKMSGDIGSMLDALCELRQTGQGTSPQAQGLARSLQGKLGELHGLVRRAVGAVERSGVQQPAHTLEGRLEQAARWLQNPAAADADRALGQKAIQLVVEEGRRAAEHLTGQPRQQLLALCNSADALSRQLDDMVRRGEGNSPQAQAIAKQLSGKLQQLRDQIQSALVDRVAEDFVDIVTPLKQFTEATLAPEGTPGRQQNFADKADTLQRFSTQAARTGRMVASAGAAGNKKLSEALQSSATEVESLCPQLVNAGSIRLQYPDHKAADEHFENLRKQYAESVTRVRDLSDEAIDAGKFIRQSEALIKKHTDNCELAAQRQLPQEMVDNTSAIARLANRVLMVAKKEADNSEDPRFIAEINMAIDRLQKSVTPMVQNAKTVAMNPADQGSVARWRSANRELLDAVAQVRKAIGPEVDIVPGMSQMELNDALERDRRGREDELNALLAGLEQVQVTRAPALSAAPPPPPPEPAPPRPPLPAGDEPPPRPPPPPETDDEEDSHVFRHAPPANQPIMAAAHGLHQEVAQWSSKDNDIISAAKRMAQLMAKLSQLVRGENGNKRELIACAKAIAEASEEVTRLAKELAHECTDKRMRTQLLQVCERIPTIGTQLKILSTVKATMLGAQGTEEDQEATDMLVGNAQNLMQSVKETVRAAEAASIKMRTDAGIQLRWVRKSPWYQ